MVNGVVISAHFTCLTRVDAANILTSVDQGPCQKSGGIMGPLRGLCVGWLAACKDACVCEKHLID